jgi:dTDP-4-dehydrorhamnose reductase
MRIVVTGGEGGLGSELPHVFSDDEVTLLSRSECDVTDSSRTEAALARANPDVIVHAAAYTAVDRAESEPEAARRVNVEGTKNVARAAKRIGTVLVYPSTDYVFDGRKNAPYLETDTAKPLSVYGRTKLEGEQAAQAEHDDTYVVRTSWLYSRAGKSFVTTILKLLQESMELKVVADEVSSPTSAHGFVSGISRLLEVRPPPGVYHLACGGETNWYDYAKEIVRLAGSSVQIKPTTSTDWGAPAVRPRYSKLNCDKLEKLDIALPDWKDDLAGFFKDTP